MNSVEKFIYHPKRAEYLNFQCIYFTTRHSHISSKTKFYLRKNKIIYYSSAAVCDSMNMEEHAKYSTRLIRKLDWNLKRSFMP